MFSSKTIKKLAGTSLAAIAVSAAAIVPSAIAQPDHHVMLAARTIANRDDRDPRLHKALAALLRAQDFLTHADKDSAGHREKALDLTHQAIEETRKAIRHDQ